MSAHEWFALALHVVLLVAAVATICYSITPFLDSFLLDRALRKHARKRSQREQALIAARVSKSRGAL